MTTWEDFLSASPRQVVAWAEEQPWARAMADCPQDPLWHAEGDVWTHTRMVADVLERLDDWPSLDRDARLKLLLTALFHDSGKPATTAPDPATGRLRSLKHSVAGMNLARSVLREVDCPLAFREEVCRLVRYHGRPPYLMEKADPGREVIALSWLVDHRLLHLFALADSRGRKTADTGRAKEALELWRMAAEDQGCYGQPYPFANDQARFLFYRHALSSLHYVPREDYRCTVTLMSGLPGAGKDSWLRDHRPEMPVVSLDDLRQEMEAEPTGDQGAVIQAARDRCRVHLRAGEDFAFNATNTMRATRKAWIDLFADYHARIEIVYIEPSFGIIESQNKGRDKRVPRKVIDRLVDRLEPPTVTEAHALTMWEG